MELLLVEETLGIFNEDFVIKDETGIIFLDDNQSLMVINKIFVLFKSKEYFDKK